MSSRGAIALVIRKGIPRLKGNNLPGASGMKTFRLALTIILSAAANMAWLPIDRVFVSSGNVWHLLLIPLGHLQVSALVIGSIRYLTRKSCPQS